MGLSSEGKRILLPFIRFFGSPVVAADQNLHVTGTGLSHAA
jgi:hypothetical protein